MRGIPIERKFGSGYNRYDGGTGRRPTARFGMGIFAVSLTSQLNASSSPLVQFFKAEFPNTRPISAEIREKLADSPTILPAVPFSPGVASTIGTAIDYRLRYYFTIT